MKNRKRMACTAIRDRGEELLSLFAISSSFPKSFSQSYRQRKKIQMQGAQILRNEAYREVRCNDEGCSATQQMDFLQSRHFYV
jgi:hypothetical protein